MKTKEKKCYVLMVSKTFPAYHPKKGQSTGFVEKLSNMNTPVGTKLHTIRANYELWLKRSVKIAKGKAYLSIRYWSGAPYKSKQVEICRLNNIFVQKLENNVLAYVPDGQYDKIIEWQTVAENDGLSYEDFCAWFKNFVDFPKEGAAIIQFTHFCY